MSTEKKQNSLKKDFLLILISTAAIVIGIHFLIKSDVCNPPVMVDFSDTTQTEDVPVFLYGLPVDSFDIIEGKVKSGQNLSTLLSKYNIPAKTIDKLILGSDSVFDLKKIRAGNKFTVFMTKDSMPVAKYLVYEHNAVEYVMFNLNDTVNIQKMEKEVRVVRHEASGEIKSSLWNAMYDNNMNPVIAIELSDIFAWTIDFFDLKKGDKFKVVYDEEFVDSTSIGISKIHVAYFYHMNKDFYAIPFVQDSIETYFDTEAQSLRKAFLKAPLQFYRITSKFTNSRYHPVLRIRRPHHGVDYAAPVGTPVMTIGDGKVVETGYKGGAGNMVKIKHNNVYSTSYMHLSKFAKGVRSGSYVKQGDVIGYVGSTGLSTGPHLDFRVYKNGSAIDPLKMESPPAEPVKKENMAAFNVLKDSLVKTIDAIQFAE